MYLEQPFLKNNSRPFVLSIFLAFFLLFVWSGNAEAAVIETGGSKVVQEDEFIDDDIYFFGDTLEVNGDVAGDVIFFGRNLIVRGNVGGSVLGAGQSSEIDGNVAGSVRFAGDDIRVSGEVERNLFTGVNSVNVSGIIGRDFYGGGNTSLVTGPISGDLKGGFRQLEINSPVQGDVRVEVNQLILGPESQIGGSVKYTSEREAEIDAGAEVTGEIVRSEPEMRTYEHMTEGFFFGFLRPALSLALAGALVGFLFPRAGMGAAAAAKTRTWRSLFFGLLILLGIPLTAFVLLFTVIGIPLSFLLMLSYIVFLYMTRVFAGFFVGRWVLELLGKELHPALTGIIGAILLVALFQIPYAGKIIHIVSVIFGAGAIFVYLLDIRDYGEV